MLDVIEAWHTVVNAGDGTAAGLTPDDEVTRPRVGSAAWP